MPATPRFVFASDSLKGTLSSLDESRHEKWCKGPPRGGEPPRRYYAALSFLSNVSPTSLRTLSTPPGSSGSGSRS